YQHDIRSFFFSSRRRHTRSKRDWSSDVCSSDLEVVTNVVVTANNTELKANGTLCIDRSQPGGTTDADSDGKGDDKPKLEIPEARSEERRVGKEGKTRE